MDIQDNYIRHVYELVDIHDGDTISVIVESGFDGLDRLKLRLKGINTAELSSETQVRIELANKAKEFVKDRIEGKKIRIHSEKFKSGGFGRYLATIFYFEDNQWKNLNEELLASHLAQVYYLGASKDETSKF